MEAHDQEAQPAVLSRVKDFIPTPSLQHLSPCTMPQNQPLPAPASAPNPALAATPSFATLWMPPSPASTVPTSLSTSSHLRDPIAGISRINTMPTAALSGTTPAATPAALADVPTVMPHGLMLAQGCPDPAPKLSKRTAKTAGLQTTGLSTPYPPKSGSVRSRSARSNAKGDAASGRPPAATSLLATALHVDVGTETPVLLSLRNTVADVDRVPSQDTKPEVRRPVQTVPQSQSIPTPPEIGTQPLPNFTLFESLGTISHDTNRKNGVLGSQPPIDVVNPLGALAPLPLCAPKGSEPIYAYLPLLPMQTQLAPPTLPPQCDASAPSPPNTTYAAFPSDLPSTFGNPFAPPCGLAYAFDPSWTPHLPSPTAQPQDKLPIPPTPSTPLDPYQPTLLARQPPIVAASQPVGPTRRKGTTRRTYNVPMEARPRTLSNPYMTPATFANRSQPAAALRLAQPTPDFTLTFAPPPATDPTTMAAMAHAAVASAFLPIQPPVAPTRVAAHTSLRQPIQPTPNPFLPPPTAAIAPALQASMGLPELCFSPAAAAAAFQQMRIPASVPTPFVYHGVALGFPDPAAVVGQMRYLPTPAQLGALTPQVVDDNGAVLPPLKEGDVIISEEFRRLWRVLRQLGKGGCGDVYLAKEDSRYPNPTLPFSPLSHLLPSPTDAPVCGCGEPGCGPAACYDAAAVARRASLACMEMAAGGAAWTTGGTNGAMMVLAGTAGVGYDVGVMGIVALKVVKDRKQFNNEILVMNLLNAKREKQCPFPRLIAYCRRQKVIAMDFLSETLAHQFERLNFTFSLKTILMLSINMLRISREFYERTSYVHVDIKPSNFCVGCSGRDLHLIDYGYATPPSSRLPGQTGTPLFMALAIQTYGAIFMFFIGGGKKGLPWGHLRTHAEIARAKSDHSLNTFFSRLTTSSNPAHVILAEPLAALLTVARDRSRAFRQREDFERVLGMFEACLTRCGFANDREYDWTRDV
ncbi:Casein kinase I isoform gamma-3 [Phlyctochytrium bullatum]|nr:Casein kinase I isoform gamma-3 [Phlyctochytrium bullatum]